MPTLKLLVETPEANCQFTEKKSSALTNPPSTASNVSTLPRPTVSVCKCEKSNSSPKDILNSASFSGEIVPLPKKEGCGQVSLTCSEKDNLLCQYNPRDSIDDKYTNEILSKAENSISIEKSCEKVHVNESILKHTPARIVSHISPVTLLSASSLNHEEANTGVSTLPINSPAHIPLPKQHILGNSCSKSSRVLLSSLDSSCAMSTFTDRHSVCDTLLSVSSGLTVTPPMCDCGRRTKRKFVAREGLNEGKPFYVCPNSSGSNKSKGCGFFKWSDSI